MEHKTDSDVKQAEKLNLYQKLVRIRQKIEYIQKSSKGYNFKYADEAAILSVIRPEMDAQGVILEMEMEKPEMISEKATQVGFVFTWVNADKPEERIVKRLYLQTQVADVQKMGSLMTYASRYFLYKYFSVPTSEMDPDAYRTNANRVTAEQLSTLEELINGDLDLREKMLNWAQAKNLGELTADKYPTILNAVKQHRNARIDND